MVGPETISSYQALKFNIETKASKIDRTIDLLKRASERGDEDYMAEAASEFESLFIYFMLKAMRGTIEKSDIFGDSRSADMYQTIFDEELAKKAAKAGGFGIARLLLNQLKPQGAETWQLTNRPGATDRQLHSANQEAYYLKSAVSSPFGYRADPFTGLRKFHRGIDVAMAEGSRIRAVKPGMVIFSGEKAGRGNMVVVESEDGYVVSYSHNKENLVRPGQHVSGGQTLALAGSTGKATGPHLHLEVKKDGKAIDPFKVINLRA